MNKIKDILTNLASVSVGTWVRLILMVLSLVNLALTSFGVNPVAVDHETLYTAVSIALAVIVGIAAYWKNNSFTSAALAADEYLHNSGFAVEDSADSTADATEEAAE